MFLGLGTEHDATSKQCDASREKRKPDFFSITEESKTEFICSGTE
jgi:hypothetical protein